MMVHQILSYGEAAELVIERLIIRNTKVKLLEKTWRSCFASWEPFYINIRRWWNEESIS